MALTDQQANALKSVADWLKERNRQQIFRLFGYAGTGKTTLARTIAEEIGGNVLFAAFTGKAAQVLRSRGASNARTIHSLIYRPRGEEVQEETGTVSPTFSINRTSPLSDASLVIIDECSMVDEELGRDLLSFGTPVLVLGDPGQLPPVSGGGFFTDHPPDVMLTEIHRQARDNPIVELARQVREGERLDYGTYGESMVVRRGDIPEGRVPEADQVLVGTNRTRHRYNRRLREIAGFDDPLPCAGDRLVCLRNDPKKGLLNGSLWTVSSAPRTTKPAQTMIVQSDDDGLDKDMVKIKVLKQAFLEPDADIPWQLQRRHDAFDFGYALTVHKAQGSQWSDVVVFDESFAFKDHPDRWLYTAITRAADRVTIVR
ncbi:ATP-dependent RecD-like DNA helicase [Tepidamorphus sp. 3E244]|uniref:ATP-dependent DNA helicase n=1 Tax=Tepidamorphus sp. 3E244 TaxID=3385498 RepID=UPI0038FBF300